MADFEVLIYKIKDPVIDHPNADRLSLIQIEGYTCISAKLEDGSHRYKQGDLVVYIPEQAVMPEWMMQDMDFWDINKNKPQFRYVKAKKLREIFSQGILYPVIDNNLYIGQMCAKEKVEEGENVADFLGITKYDPVVPSQMAGQMHGAYMEYTMKYDFDSIQKHMHMFEEGEEVTVTEKIHGTLIEIGYIPELNDPMLFGKNNNIFVTSKGVGAKGFIYKNVPENDGNLYVKMLKELLANKLEDVIDSLYQGKIKSLHLFGEVFGKGIQDLDYGQSNPTFKLFDIALDKEYLPPNEFDNVSYYLELEKVPTLYKGPYDFELMKTFRDGKTTMNSGHIREGIVIKGNGNHSHYGRKIAKFVSPDYLLRKGNTTEFA